MTWEVAHQLVRGAAPLTFAAKPQQQSPLLQKSSGRNEWLGRGRGVVALSGWLGTSRP